MAINSNTFTTLVSQAKDSTVAKLGDAVAQRLNIAGLFPNAKASARPAPKASVQWLDSGVTPANQKDDWRISVSTDANILYNANFTDSDTAILQPLVKTMGVNFPITPTIQVTHTATYSNQRLTHSNYAMQFYEGSEVASIAINGEFPIQSIEEGQYLLAAIYFFRSATKMFWGNEDKAGTPPPLLYLDGYGDYYFPHVPCVLTNFTHSLPDNVDYLEIPITDTNGQYAGSTRLPMQSQLQIQLQPIYSRSSLNQFSLEDFAKGNLLNGGFM